TYTFAAPLYKKIIENFENKNIEEARRLQMVSIKMVQSLVKFSPIPAQRTIVDMGGFSLGVCRLPLIGLNADEVSRLKEDLESKDFFNLVDQCRDTFSVISH